MRSKLNRVAVLTVILLSALLTARYAKAQALPSVDRGAELTPFALATNVNPDWGLTHNLGYSAGLDYTRFARGVLQPSLEFRYTRATGQTVNESALLGGLKLQGSIRKVHPYLLALAGRGYLTVNYFNSGYNSDTAVVYAVGGGADLDVTPVWRVKADFTTQHWNLDPNTLTPSAISMGIAYRLPFGPRVVR